MIGYKYYSVKHNPVPFYMAVAFVGIGFAICLAVNLFVILGAVYLYVWPVCKFVLSLF